MAAEHSGRVIPKHVSEYLKPEYWESRCQLEDSYDWLADYDRFGHLLSNVCFPNTKILIVGCGTSSMAQKMYNSGVTNLTCIDLSSGVIDKMTRLAEVQGLRGVKWIVGDIMSLPFDDSTFDVVIDKATIDVLFVDNDSEWSPKPEVKERVFKTVDEIHRVLTPTGVFVSITWSQPHFRKMFYGSASYSWNVEVDTFGSGMQCFVYRMRKGARTGPILSGIQSLGYNAKLLEHNTYHDHMDDERFLSHIEL